MAPSVCLELSEAPSRASTAPRHEHIVKRRSMGSDSRLGDVNECVRPPQIAKEKKKRQGKRQAIHAREEKRLEEGDGGPT